MNSYSKQKRLSILKLFCVWSRMHFIGHHR